jgi:hypothetical protein
VDWRVKTFESEARLAFGFLIDQGFTVSASAPTAVTRRPTSLTVRFLSSGATVETELALGLAGEDGIYTCVITTQGSFEVGPSIAHKGHEMRAALLAHAAQVRDILQR